MATVIDRLLVQGGSAPGCHFDREQPSRRSDRILAPRNSPKQGFNKDVRRQQYPSTPIAKRMEFFSKIREANIGLSSMDSPNIHPGDDTVNKVNFVLNGKSVTSQNGNIRKPGTAIPKPFRAGSYKTTPRDLYRVSHGISLKTGTEHSPFGHGIHAVFEHDNYSSDGQLLRMAKSSSNPRDVLNGASSTSLSTTVPPPSTAPSSAMKTSDSLRSATLTSLELTGQKYAGNQSDNFYFYDSTILDNSCFPYLRSPRKRTRFPRSSFNDGSFTDVTRSHELQDCLKIKKSFMPASRESVPQSSRYGEGVTNTMRKLETESVNKDLRRYEFSNLNSYLSFNRYNTNSKQRIAQIPRGVVSLPAPWAETVLLKLMGDLQNPTSRLSSAKHSDIGAHEVSDEFFVIGSPTSLEKHARLLGGQRSQGKRDLGNKSAVSVKAAERIDEVEEDVLETGCTARAPTARSEISSVDMRDIENRKMQLESRLTENADSKGGDLFNDPVSRQCSASAPGDINEESRLGSEETIEQKEILRVVVKNENTNIVDAIADNGETIAIKHNTGL